MHFVIVWNLAGFCDRVWGHRTRPPRHDRPAAQVLELVHETMLRLPSAWSGKLVKVDFAEVVQFAKAVRASTDFELLESHLRVEIRSRTPTQLSVVLVPDGRRPDSVCITAVCHYSHRCSGLFRSEGIRTIAFGCDFKR